MTVTMLELVAAALLVLYGNAMNALLRPALPGGGRANVALGLIASAVAVAAGRRAGLSPAEMGLHRWASGTALGIASTVAFAGPAVAALSRPPLLAGPIVYAPAQAVSAQALARHLAVALPLGVVLPEELLFRGTLQAALRRRIGAPAAVATTAVLFALWHATSLSTLLRDTDLGLARRTRAVTVAGAASVLLLGGAVFGALREASGGLVAPLLAHWGFNAAVLLRLRR